MYKLVKAMTATWGYSGNRVTRELFPNIDVEIQQKSLCMYNTTLITQVYTKKTLKKEKEKKIKKNTSFVNT
jgi:hypothetical protein